MTQYVYKLGIPGVFGPLRGSSADIVPLSKLDEKDGFIHLSSAKQVPGTVERFFSEHAEIEILKIAVSTIEHKLRWEESSSHGIFPHIYGNLLASDIVESRTFRRRHDSSWQQQLEAELYIA